MSDDRERYFDFSEDKSLLHEFDPNQVSSFVMRIHGEQISKEIQRTNPIIGLQGLVGYLILTNAANSTGIESRLNWLILVGIINALLLTYIVHLAT